MFVVCCSLYVVCCFVVGCLLLVDVCVVCYLLIVACVCCVCVSYFGLCGLSVFAFVCFRLGVARWLFVGCCLRVVSFFPGRRCWLLYRMFDGY